MAMNPMQKKARTSFLLGMFITLIIAGAIIAFLIMQLGQARKKDEEVVLTDVYTVSAPISSGGEIVANNNVTISQMDKKLVPGNALNSTNALNYLVEGATSKIALQVGTIVTTEMINTDAENSTSDVRLKEYNMISLPSNLQEKDYIDIRLMLPTGEDYIVLSKKCVEKATADTIWLKVREDEILTMSNVIVESYIIEGSLLYAIPYTDAGIQKSSTPTYIVSDSVLQLIRNSSENILTVAANKLVERASGAKHEERTKIDAYLNELYADERAKSVETKLEENIQKQQTARQQYVDSLGVGTGTTTK